MRTLIPTKYLFVISLLVIALTIVSVWLFGLGTHRSLYQNSLLSTSILSAAFFLFMNIGLYNGIKLKDTVGRLTDKINLDKFPNLSGAESLPDLSFPGDSLIELLSDFLVWIILAGLFVVLLAAFSLVFWYAVVIFAAMLYWIFFRALRRVFKHSAACKGQLLKSAGVAAGYTVAYNIWIYAILIALRYFLY